MKSISITDNNYCLNYPEDIHVKRTADGHYNLYALIRTSYTQDGKNCESLLSVKSEQLSWKHDFDMTFGINSKSNVSYLAGKKGGKLYPFTSSITREILYNLSFSKDVETLVQFEIMNNGEGKNMKYNIYEELDRYNVEINVAGFSKDELDVVFDQGVIKVRAIPDKCFDSAYGKCLSQEFSKVESECEIYLPNVCSIEAELEDGILYLGVDKKIVGERIEIKNA